MTRVNFLAIASFFLIVPFGWFTYVTNHPVPGVGPAELLGATFAFLGIGLIFGAFFALLLAAVAGKFKPFILPAWAAFSGVAVFLAYYPNL